MSGEQIQATYFSPFQFFMYLLLVLVIMVVCYQYAWSKKCNNFVKVLVVKPDGTTDTQYAPKSGGYVALKGLDSNTTRLWPINKLCAIEEMYPGDGFIPKFLQKKIKTVIVDEEDWEPLLNRGSYTAMVASPDVVAALRAIADRHPREARELNDLIVNLSTAPTRDMVASPAVLGNIMKEKVSEMAVTISKDTFDKMAGLTSAIAKMPNAIVVYLGLGIIAILLVVVVVKVMGMGDVASITEGLEAIKNALGIVPKVVP